MARLVDWLGDYFDQKGETFGAWYTRCLIGLLWLSAGVGYVTGLGAGFLCGLRP